MTTQRIQALRNRMILKGLSAICAETEKRATGTASAVRLIELAKWAKAVHNSSKKAS